MKNILVLATLLTACAFASGDEWSAPLFPPDVWSGEPEPGELDWGDDDEIYGVDSVVQVRLDYSDSLFMIYCLLKYEGNGNTINIKPLYSPNGGTAWTGPHTYTSVNPIPGLDLAVLRDHVYMLTGQNLPSRSVILRRFNASDMRQDTFPRGEDYIEVGEYTSDIVECRLVNNHYGNGQRTYVGVITADHRMHFFQLGTHDFVPHELGLGNYPDDANKGLNMAYNEESGGGYLLLFSYINTSGQVQVYGVTYMAPDTHRFNVSVPTNGSYTGLAAWQDTFMVTYDHVSTDGIQARYMTSYDDGATWRWGFFGDTTTPTVRSADITGRNGYGQAVSFWQYPQSTGGISFTHRNYRGAWSEPARIQDYSSYSNRLSDIEHIGDGAYGIVYVRSTRNGVAYFDRSDWTGIQEPVPILPAEPRDTRPTFARGLLDLGTHSGVLIDASGREVQTLNQGRNDISKVEPGVYFVRREDGTSIGKVLIAR